MKWAALALLLLMVPALAAWLRTNPNLAVVLWGGLTFLPFVLTPWHMLMATYSMPFWSGYVKGWEVTALDALALAILFGTRNRWRGMVLVVPFALYFLAVLVAVMQARFGTIAFGYPVQLIRVALVFLAVAQVARMDRGERALVTGLILGLTVQALYALWARAGGALQTGGSMGHQNLLGFASHMAVMPAFAMLLAGRYTKTALLGVVSGLVVVALTASRGTIIISGFGMVLVLVLSLGLRFSGRKAIVAMGGVAALAVGSYFAFESLNRRFAVQGQMALFEEDAQRPAFEKAAYLMIENRPFGVGPNHYVFVANTEGYSARAGVDWSTGNRSANVHNAFLLVWVETGLLGLITLIALLGSAIWHAFSKAMKWRRRPEADMFIATGVAIVCISIHSFVEWVLVMYSAQYLIACTLGMIAGMSMRLRASSKQPAARPVMAPLLVAGKNAPLVTS
ncbi:O-antigen ligase [Sphingomonas kaistensis]|uniref:O-antigen ligase n=1 Tax=Sphingomonas kaistensis TaxID=298708 RepID=A0A7X5Y3I2_9SPHN|nr:O-antigen ligase family protein [Sphingomonas kaistensis]NJC04499.1 O-antigen ligase [Sphingomonas kaistensis]